VGGGLFGFFGMLLGVPTLALILYIIDRIMVYRTENAGLPQNPADYIDIDHITADDHQIVRTNDKLSRFGRRKP
jgi:hypothetical protein